MMPHASVVLQLMDCSLQAGQQTNIAGLILCHSHLMNNNPENIGTQEKLQCKSSVFYTTLNFSLLGFLSFLLLWKKYEVMLFLFSVKSHYPLSYQVIFHTKQIRSVFVKQRH